MHPFLYCIQQSLERANIDFVGKRLLLLVSGGSDSMTLLHSIHALYGAVVNKLVILSINYSLRGDDSFQDQFLVVSFCKTLGLKCYAYTVKKPPLNT